jgi:hypothetical protein
MFYRSRSSHGDNQESTLLQAASPFYKTFAIECSRAQVSVDMFLFSSSYQDVATLGNIFRGFHKLGTYRRVQRVSPTIPPARPTSTQRSTPRVRKTLSSSPTSLAVS